MRILMLTDRFPPEARANAHLFHELATGLVERGHQLGVVTRMPGDYIPPDQRAVPTVKARERVDGIEVIRVRGLTALHRASFMRALDQFAVGFTFGLAARSWPGADVVLIYSPPLPLVIAGLLYCRFGGAPYVLNLHDLYPQTAIDLGLLRNRALVAAARCLERLAYRHAARIVVPAARSRDVLVAINGFDAEKICLVPNWADLDRVAPGPKENEFRRLYGLSGRFVVTYAGVMGFAQDLAPVVEAARRLQVRPDIVFLLVGDGIYLDRWKQMAQGLTNIRFLPMQAKSDYFQLLRASDVCLVPLARALDSPAIPGKIQSIMAVARPVLVIANPNGDAGNLIAKSQCGVSAPPERPDEVAARILQFYNDPQLGEALGANGRRYAEQNFSMRRAVRAWEEILEAVAARARRAR
jgi:colanic acid biosynthesis glycosyl transferase WcaI